MKKIFVWLTPASHQVAKGYQVKASFSPRVGFAAALLRCCAAAHPNKNINKKCYF
jgi:hypothetical protein